jgi:membrane protein DedA with SNARE-associated domain
LKHLLVALVAAFGDLSFLRFFAALASSFVLVAVGYWLALPRELPLWPGVIVVLAGAAFGLAWERASRRKGEL